MNTTPTGGEAVVRLLEAHGVDTVFGIPGVHTLGLYRGLAGSRIRHVTPRHEQGAGFMADGYARASGRPGVAFVITGPGVTNIATPLGQAMSDSVPLLVISSVAARRDLGAGRLRLHEITRQIAVTSPLTGWNHTVLDPDELPRVFARVFGEFVTDRPLPVHIELPLDVIDAPCSADLWVGAGPLLRVPEHDPVQRAAAMLAAAVRPLIVVGGGAIGCAAAALAERLGAPVLSTAAGAGVVAADHPLAAGLGLSSAAGLAAVADADVVLVVGSDMSETGHWQDRLPVTGKLIRIDIDPTVLKDEKGLFLCADATLAVAALIAYLSVAPRPDGVFRTAGLRAAINAELAIRQPEHVAILAAIREGLPRDGLLLTDMTQIAYTANSVFPVLVPRGLLHPSGFGTLGWALPAAIGAKLARPEVAVVCVIGDGGLQFTAPELTPAVELGLPLPVVVCDNGGYGQIRDDMRARGLAEIGVNVGGPDLALLAAAHRCRYVRPDVAALPAALTAALAADRPTLVHVTPG